MSQPQNIRFVMSSNGSNSSASTVANVGDKRMLDDYLAQSNANSDDQTSRNVRARVDNANTTQTYSPRTITIMTKSTGGRATRDTTASPSTSNSSNSTSSRPENISNQEFSSTSVAEKTNDQSSSSSSSSSSDPLDLIVRMSLIQPDGFYIPQIVITFTKSVSGTFYNSIDLVSVTSITDLKERMAALKKALKSTKAQRRIVAVSALRSGMKVWLKQKSRATFQSAIQLLAKDYVSKKQHLYSPEAVYSVMALAMHHSGIFTAKAMTNHREWFKELQPVLLARIESGALSQKFTSNELYALRVFLSKYKVETNKTFVKKKTTPTEPVGDTIAQKVKLMYNNDPFTGVWSPLGTLQLPHLSPSRLKVNKGECVAATTVRVTSQIALRVKSGETSIGVSSFKTKGLTPGQPPSLCFPKDTSIYVNNKRIPLTKRHMPLTVIESGADISAGMLKIRIESFYECHCSYRFSVDELTKKELRSAVTQVVGARKNLEKARSTFISRFFGEDDGADDEDGFMIDNDGSLSLLCPLTMTRMSTPVRGSACQHYACFDLVNYIQVNKLSRKFECPVCNKKTYTANLQVDAFLEEILGKVGNEVTEVVLQRDGQWQSRDGKYRSKEETG
eukprot:TRINITY_DN683_c0_g1_i13.p1 TRINITY_DN683_c0_g1~~TRINITY_DN683_c0_g1_i13.p1  ORF type:complete len:629 (-),score=169.83 TRINITY_DN683_c0_g1_i13:311-2167(-)